MNSYQDLGAALGAAFTQVGSRIMEHLPNILGAAALLLAGWLIARVLRALAVRVMHVIELLLLRLSRAQAGRPTGIPSASIGIVASILFWAVMLLFVAAATHVLGLGAFSSWLQGLMGYLPTLVAGALIIIAGILLSGFSRDLVVAALVALPEPKRLLLGRIVQGVVLVTAVAVGADQIGIKITFLVILAAVVTSAVVGGVALAVSFGARAYVANLIGAHYLRQAFRVGERVRIRGMEGTIRDITAVSLILDTPQGRTSIPASVYNEEPIVLLGAESDDA